jgi:hypothetical protein
MPELLSLLHSRYPELAKDLLGPVLELLDVGRATCDGDLDKLLIVLVVGMRTAEDKRVVELNLEDVLSGAVETFPSLQTNVRSIADSTGIPKETVRRKVQALIDDGWIHRQDGALSMAPAAARRLTDLREQIFRTVIVYHQLVEAVQRQGE